MQILTVLNEMLGTMGETPLSTLEDPHTFRGACLSTLTKENRLIQARGWWFNTETVTLAPQVNGRISLAGDCISVRNLDRDVVQRGRYLYNRDGGTFDFTDSIDVELIRLLNFEDLPETAAGYVSACAVRKFQLKYDGDRAKADQLREDEVRAYGACNTEHIRNERTNFITGNAKLQRLKGLTNGARRYIR